MDEQRNSRERIAGALSPYHDVILAEEPGEALIAAREETIDLMIVSLGSGAFDGLRLCSQARSHERTRNLPILLIADPDDRPKVLRGLELGANDYLTRPIDRNELLARVRTNIRQKLYADRLRQSVQQSIEMALYNSLTGLNNRRSLERRLPAMIETARARGAPLTMMVLDIDHFKRVNDTYGHDVGDRVLKGFGAQLQETVRSGDLICRLGRRGIRRRDAGRRRCRSGADRRTRAPDHREPRIPGRRRGRLRFDYGFDRSRRMAGELELRRALSSSGPSALPIEVGGPQSRHSGRGASSDESTAGSNRLRQVLKPRPARRASRSG